MEYKKLRDAALRSRSTPPSGRRRYPRLSDERPSQERDLAGDRIKEVELWDLVSALARVLRRGVVEHQTSVRDEEIPLAVHMQAVGQRVREEGRVAFSAFFDKTSKRSVIVGLFLAILELLRHHGFRAEQAADYGEIWIRPPINDTGGPLVPVSEKETVAEEEAAVPGDEC